MNQMSLWALLKAIHIPMCVVTIYRNSGSYNNTYCIMRNFHQHKLPYFLDFFPPSNSYRTVTQPHSLLATRMTWTTQIACLAGLYTRTVLHCTYLVFVPYKGVSRVHFDGARRSRLKLIEPAIVLFAPLYFTSG